MLKSPYRINGLSAHRGEQIQSLTALPPLLLLAVEKHVEYTTAPGWEFGGLGSWGCRD